MLLFCIRLKTPCEVKLACLLSNRPVNGNCFAAKEAVKALLLSFFPNSQILELEKIQDKHVFKFG